MSRFQVKAKSLNDKYEEYRAKAARGESTVQVEGELKTLQLEHDNFSQMIPTNVQDERNELMKPIADRLNKAMVEIADELGYDYVFNTLDGNGVSILLVGPQKDDLTEKIMTKLGTKPR